MDGTEVFLGVFVLAAGFYIALMGEFLTTTLLSYWLQKSARKKLDTGMKKFEQLLMMAQQKPEKDVDEDSVN